MNMQPIQVLEDGVLIPVEYLSNARNFEFERINGHVMVRPKIEQDVVETEKDVDYMLPSESSRFSFVGIAETRNPYASEEVEEVLKKELGHRSEDA